MRSELQHMEALRPPRLTSWGSRALERTLKEWEQKVEGTRAQKVDVWDGNDEGEGTRTRTSMRHSNY